MPSSSLKHRLFANFKAKGDVLNDELHGIANPGAKP
jgi:hypothetical protein